MKKITGWLAAWMAVAGGFAAGAEIFVAPAGDDANGGTRVAPLRTFGAARDAARKFAGREPVSVKFLSGTYYLSETVRLGPEDSGSSAAPVVYEAAGEGVVLSGGARLELKWEAAGDGLFKASTPPGLAIDQLYLDGRRQRMARFPNAVPGKAVFDVWDLRHGAKGDPAQDPLAPERVARWADPAGGYFHAMHPSLWGDMHWRILGKAAGGGLEMEGGWQNNRPGKPHGAYRFVENIREELDAPGEWYHDAKAGVLTVYPPEGVTLAKAVVEVVRLAHLIEIAGTRERPVRFVALRGFTFRHAARTFMENKEPLLRSDWTVYRGGAVVFTGGEDCAVEDCVFDQVGGNTVFVNNYNRRIAVRGCWIRESGANGVAFVGDPKAVRNPIFRYGPQDYAKLDLEPGPIGENYPADCVVEDCLITRTGRDEKQTAPVQISMARRITVRHCSIYDVPRAGINISEGTWGGHVIEGCDVFDTVRETGDHGSFNSWGRDRFWTPRGNEMAAAVAANPALPFLDVVEPITIRDSRWRCDHGWDIDLDDGSTRYVITRNVLLNGGLKLREGYARTATNNVIVNNSLHPHCWPPESGDVFKANIVMGAYRPAAIDGSIKWGKEVDGNLFATSEDDRVRFAKNGCDANSRVGDPMFVDAARGDYTVRPGSPALALGFQNFPMDRFGVRKPALRAVAKTPVIPALKLKAAAAAPAAPAAAGGEGVWMGAVYRDLRGEEFSALGVASGAAGVYLAEVPAGSEAARRGFEKGDFVVRFGAAPVPGARQFPGAAKALSGAGSVECGIVRDQQERVLRLTLPLPMPSGR